MKGKKNQNVPSMIIQSKLNETDLIGERQKQTMQFSFGQRDTNPNSDMASFSPNKTFAPRSTLVTVESPSKAFPPTSGPTSHAG